MLGMAVHLRHLPVAASGASHTSQLPPVTDSQQNITKTIQLLNPITSSHPVSLLMITSCHQCPKKCVDYHPLPPCRGRSVSSVVIRGNPHSLCFPPATSTSRSPGTPGKMQDGSSCHPKQRISKACDRCHRQKLKVRSPPNRPPSIPNANQIPSAIQPVLAFSVSEPVANVKPPREDPLAEKGCDKIMLLIHLRDRNQPRLDLRLSSSRQRQLRQRRKNNR